MIEYNFFGKKKPFFSCKIDKIYILWESEKDNKLPFVGESVGAEVGSSKRQLVWF